VAGDYGELARSYVSGVTERRKRRFKAETNPP
jgi:hypothetical protein